MRIYQNEQIGDIYRVLRGKLEDSIDNFNTVIKNIERDFLKKCAKECTEELSISEKEEFIEYLDNLYLTLDETDSIILSYYIPSDKKSYSIAFTISPASKVLDSIDFYEKTVEVLVYYSELLKEYSYYYKLFSHFNTLKKDFIAFADL